jgi:serine phosphatase RsbU (regulator of sigma subunit)
VLSAVHSAAALRIERPAANGGPGRLAAPQSPAQLRELLAGALGGLLADARFELYLTDAETHLVPVDGRGDTRNGSRRLLATLRSHLLARRQDLTEPHALPALRDLQRCSVMSAPLLDDAGTFIGLAVVEAAPGTPDLGPAELDLLAGFASLLSIALQRLRARDPAQARRELDLAAAGRVQRRLMSGTLPPDVGVTALAEYHPALGVGGDFYSLQHLGGRQVSVAIGDVSGNGVSAALVMSRVASDMERALAAGEAPSTVLGKINAALSDVESETFVTASCIRLDTGTGAMTVANAGHLPLIVRRASGEVFTCGAASGMPLGMVPCDYTQEELLLGRSDFVLLMTDGLLEALDHPSGHTGMQLLLREVGAAPHDPRVINERIRAAVDRARSRHALDDVTWVGLQLVA